MSDVSPKSKPDDDGNEPLSTMPFVVVSSSSNNNNGPDNETADHSSRVVAAEDDDDDDSRWSNFYYLTEAAAAQLPHYQYKGQDQSLLYHYVLSPLATFCVQQWTPRHVAPNTITLTGLVFMVVAYGLLWYHVPTLIPPSDPDEPLPRWIFAWNGVALLVYQTLDNMDGKQARRTGSSSPLGLLFDHGCDAVNSVFGSANWIIGCALHPVSDVYLCFAMLFGPYGLFFVGTWEEYYTGELIMPIMNGPNEGLMGGAIMSFTSWWYGPAFWQQTYAWDAILRPILGALLPVAAPWLDMYSLRHADLLVLASSIGFVQEISLKIVAVVRVYGIQSISNLLPFVTLVGCAVIVGRTDLDVWTDMPRTSLQLCSTLFTEMTVDLMMAHMTKQEYGSLWKRWTLLPLVVLTLAVASGHVGAGRPTADFLIAYASAATGYLVLKSVIVVHEMCCVLNIWCFDITTTRRKRNAAVIQPTKENDPTSGEDFMMLQSNGYSKKSD